MLDISAMVLTLNEEENIACCLASLDFCREIVVVDSGSSDRTREIARSFTDKVLQHQMDGFGSQRNYCIEQAENDWIFWLDADERVSPELKAAIEEAPDKTEYSGFYVNRRTFYLGRWIHHSGWYPQYVLRLFNRKNGRCSPAKIHESIILEGSASRLKGDILHYPYRSLSRHLAKIDDYTTAIAGEEHLKGRRFNPLVSASAPAGEFFKKYILKKGFLDGFPGLAIAVSSAYYTFLKQAKLYEIQKVHQDDDEEIYD